MKFNRELFSIFLVSIAMILMLVSVTGAAPFAYITNYGSNTVSVIDTATNSITATVNVGDSPVGVAVAPDGTKVYVTNWLGNTVSVINTSTNIVATNVPVGDHPVGVAVTPNGKYVYVANGYSNDVSVINTATNIVVATVRIAGSYPSGVAANPNGKYVYVTTPGSNNVHAIDTSTNTIAATITVGSSPVGVAVSPDGKYAYVANAGGNTASVINTTTNTVATNVNVGSEPEGVAVTPDGKYAYVTNGHSNNVYVINTATYTITATVPVGSYPSGVAVTPDGRKVYVSSMASGTVSIIDTATNTVTNTIHVGGSPYSYGQFIQPYYPVLTISKLASPTTYFKVGEKITYTYTVNNSGYAGVTGPINITDNKTGTFTISTSELEPGQNVTGTANYTITQDDLDNGSVTNSAFATGVFNDIEVISPNVTATVVANQNPAMITVKLISTETYSTVGQNITYTYVLVNSGNVRITGPINVSDNKTGTFTISSNGLAAGKYVVGTANYKITQDDLDNGSVTNEAFASGFFNGAEVKSDNVTATVIAKQSPSLLTVKIASPTTYSTVGENITYTYTVNNSGNVRITGPINVTDNKTGTFTINNSGFVPGQNVTGTANYTITQEDLDNGFIINEAFATGFFYGTEVKSDNVTAIVIANQTPSLLTVKIASPTTYSTVGENITYTYTVNNSGNVKISAPINITDNKTGTFTISSNALATGQNVTGTADYIVTQDDLDNGFIANEAFATGFFNGTDVKSDNVTATVIANQNPSLLTVKIASPITYSTVGENITYTYNVTNSGNVGIVGPINVTDNKTGTFTINNSGLAPGQNVTGTANYTIIQEDLDNGSVTNEVFAIGRFGNNVITSNTANATVIANQSPALTTVKSASPTTYSAVGQNITYTYVIVNSGNVGITGPINVTDNKTGSFTISNSGLAPGQNVIGTANYTIIQADLDNSSVTNEAYATGKFNGNTVTSNQVTKTVTVVQNPALTITKIANPTTYNKVRQRITYRYTVTNTGKVPVRSIAITDNKTKVLFTSGILINGYLAPGSSLTGVGMYTIKQADITAGLVTNSAIATGKFNKNTFTSNQVTVTVKYMK